MKVLFFKLLIIAIFILSSRCNLENKKTNQNNFDKKTNIITGIDYSNALAQADIIQFLQKPKLDINRKAFDCFFCKKQNLAFPT